MANFEQMYDMKVKLYDNLSDAIDISRVHIGEGLTDTDVIGVIERVKLDYYFNLKAGDL